MADKNLSAMTDMIQSITFDQAALLTTSTINALHFPDLTTSGISDSGGGRMVSLNLDGVGMCESMTESYCSVGGQEESGIMSSSVLQNDMPVTPTMRQMSKKEAINAQKKRRSRKAQYDAATDGFSLDKIETVNVHEDNEPDDVWLFQLPNFGSKINSPSENIFSWVHKEFKENDIHATRHRLLCKLDDVSHARTIRSVSCHNFAGNQSLDNVKRSSTEQQVTQEPFGSNHNRMVSPLRTATPVFNGNGNTRPTSPAGGLSPLRHTVNITTTTAVRSRDVSREREREPLDYTDLEVMAKVQLENLRQAERQGPLSKRFGGSSNTLLSTDSRDVSPSSVFGATRNTSPVNYGYLTPRRSYSPSSAAPTGRVPIRKNSFVITESQYVHVLPSVSPRAGSPAIRTGQWSGRVTPSALETCMETSFIATSSPLQSSLLPKNIDDTFTDDAPGGSNVSLASTNSSTTLSITNQAGQKPPVIPKSTFGRNGAKPNNHRRSNTQTISTTVPNGYDLPDVTDTRSPPTTNRPNTTPNNNNRTRPPISRPAQPYRGSQTSFNNTNNSPKVQSTPSGLQKPAKKSTTDLGSTFTAKQLTSTDNGFLNDVSNRPFSLTQNRSQMAIQRRTPTQSSVEKIPQSSSIDMTTATLTNGQSSIPRSSSSLSQGRKSGIPTIGKQQRPSIPTTTRPSSSNAIPSSQSSDNMMVTRNIRTPASITRPQIPDTMSPTSSWNEGCY